MKNRIALTVPNNYLWGILGLFSAFVIILFGILNGTNINETLKFCILSFVLVIIMVYYIGSLNNANKLAKTLYFNQIIISSYVVSLLISCLVYKPNEIVLWLICGLIVSTLFDMQLGLLLNYNLIIIAGFIGKLNVESIIYLLILSTLMCMLSSSMKETSTIGYVIIIVLSVQITLLFIVNNFYIWDVINVDAFLSLISSLSTICITGLLYKLYHEKIHHEKMLGNGEIVGVNLDTKLETMEKDLIYQRKDLLTKQESSKELIGELMGTHSYDEILQPDFPLLIKLKNYSNKFYNKLLKMGELCENAAKAIGARENLAKAGGIYCQIGMIESKQYVEAGVKLVEDYHMPILIKDIILQHNMKLDKPKTPEAAIVMFAVSILSTREYLQNKMKDSLSIEKIVENVFQLRLLKGSLDESGLTVEQYNKLKTFFLKI